MNLQDIKYKIQGLATIAGVEVYFDKEGKTHYTYALFELKSGELILKDHSYFQTESDLKEKLGSKIPVVFTFSGKGILTKKVLRIDPKKTLLQHLVPNAKEKDFIVQHVVINKENYLSVVRSQQIEAILENFKIDTTLAVFLSGVPTINLLTELGENTDNLHFGHHHYIAKEYSCQETVQNSTLEKLTIPPEVIVAFTGVFDFVLQRQESVILNSPINHDKREDWIITSSIKQLGIVFLAVLFISLIFNFGLWNSYAKQAASLETKASLFKSLITKENKLSMELKNNRQFLQEIGWQYSTRFSFYVDRIALTIPNKVKLYDANLFPLDTKATRKAHRNIYQKQFIYLHGYVKDSRTLNDWVEELEKKDWLQHVKLDRYDFNDKLRQGDFTLKLKVNEGL